MRRGFSPRDVDLLLADLTGRSTAWLIAHGEEDVDERAFETLLARRYAGEPIQYIRGRAEFYGRDFHVDHRVLIPRPETELLVEAALARVPHGARVVDVGTGSGCIAVTLSLERADLRVTGVDLSIDALLVARANARALDARVRFAASDLLDAVSAFDVIVTNPPYIAAEDVDSLEKQVRDFEPRIALTPGPQGTEAISRILAAAQRKPVLMEIGFGQAEVIRDVAAARGYNVDALLDDLAGIPRVVVLSAAW